MMKYDEIKHPLNMLSLSLFLIPILLLNYHFLPQTFLAFLNFAVLETSAEMVTARWVKHTVWSRVIGTGSQ